MCSHFKGMETNKSGEWSWGTGEREGDRIRKKPLGGRCSEDWGGGYTSVCFIAVVYTLHICYQ